MRVSRRTAVPASMHIDKKLFLQRALLAFTTGLFLACAARISAAQPAHHAAAPTATTPAR